MPLPNSRAEATSAERSRREWQRCYGCRGRKHGCDESVQKMLQRADSLFADVVGFTIQSRRALESCLAHGQMFPAALTHKAATIEAHLEMLRGVVSEARARRLSEHDLEARIQIVGRACRRGLDVSGCVYAELMSAVMLHDSCAREFPSHACMCLHGLAPVGDLIVGRTDTCPSPLKIRYVLIVPYILLSTLLVSFGAAFTCNARDSRTCLWWPGPSPRRPTLAFGGEGCEKSWQISR